MTKKNNYMDPPSTKNQDNNSQAKQTFNYIFHFPGENAPLQSKKINYFNVKTKSFLFYFKRYNKNISK